MNYFVDPSFFPPGYFFFLNCYPSSSPSHFRALTPTHNLCSYVRTILEEIRHWRCDGTDSKSSCIDRLLKASHLICSQDQNRTSKMLASHDTVVRKSWHWAMYCGHFSCLITGNAVNVLEGTTSHTWRNRLLVHKMTHEVSGSPCATKLHCNGLVISGLLQPLVVSRGCCNINSAYKIFMKALWVAISCVKGGMQIKFVWQVIPKRVLSCFDTKNNSLQLWFFW